MRRSGLDLEDRALISRCATRPSAQAQPAPDADALPGGLRQAALNANRSTPMRLQAKDALIETLRARFETHRERHEGVAWAEVRARLEASEAALETLAAMEHSGGEPDVIGYDKQTRKYIFCDCCAESPAGRRSLCFDRKALESRKANKPKGCAADLAAAMGAELLTEQQYRDLQELGEFDARTSSWVATPEPIRSLGGALFCDRRYGKVFVYHNGAESYYAARGFRARLSV